MSVKIIVPDKEAMYRAAANFMKPDGTIPEYLSFEVNETECQATLERQLKREREAKARNQPTEAWLEEMYNRFRVLSYVEDDGELTLAWKDTTYTYLGVGERDLATLRHYIAKDWKGKVWKLLRRINPEPKVQKLPNHRLKYPGATPILITAKTVR